MALDSISVSQYPDVPSASGVPQMARSSTVNTANTVTIQSSSVQNSLYAATQSNTTWGIYSSDGKTQVINPDNFLSFTLDAQWRVSDFPVQEGSFNTYNKVTTPNQYAIGFTKGGSLSDRTTFLKALSDIAGTTDQYIIYTPEATYTNATIEHYKIVRTGAVGAYYFADVEVFFRQINSVSVQYSSSSANTTNAQNAAATPQSSSGTLTAVNVTDPGVTSSVTTALQNLTN